MKYAIIKRWHNDRDSEDGQQVVHAKKAEEKIQEQ